MRVRLKGINRVNKKLADGTERTYWYAWKGGPPLPGKPGSEEFMAAYNSAVVAKVTPPTGTLFSVLGAYQQSDDFLRLADRTRQDYVQQITKIEAEFGDFPLAAMSDKRTRGLFKSWRDQLALTSRRQADYAFTVLALILAWGVDRGLVDHNPCERAGRLYRGSRVDKVWTEADEAAFYENAPAHLHLSVMLALWTGQRKGDLLRLTWFNYDGERIRLRQGKTGARVTILVGEPLRAALDATERRGERILLTVDGDPWTENGFSSSFKKAMVRAGIVGLTFNDMRGTAVTRLAKVGCTVPEIATLTGHSLRDVGAILDAHYLNRDSTLAEAAIRKLEKGTRIPN